MVVGVNPSRISIEAHGDSWSLFVDGVRMVDRESYTIVERLSRALQDRRAYPGTETREVADSIAAHVGEWPDPLD